MVKSAAYVTDEETTSATSAEEAAVSEKVIEKETEKASGEEPAQLVTGGSAGSAGYHASGILGLYIKDGKSFVNKGTILVEKNATMHIWPLSDEAAGVAGADSAMSGTFVLTNAGTITNNGMFMVGDHVTLDNTGGSFTNAKGATVYNYGVIKN